MSMEAIVVVIIIIIIVIAFASASKNKNESDRKNISKSITFPLPPNTYQSNTPNNFKVNVKVEYSSNDDFSKERILQYEWIPHNKSITIKNFIINDGLIYVGKNSSLQKDYLYSDEPSAIYPSLNINFNNPDNEGIGLGYWPSFTNLSPESRAGYLNWLSKGRSNPNTPIGYVFIFFYGLEKRLLVDLEKDPDQTESNIILNEIERLLSIYGNNYSFHSYASSLLDFEKGFASIDEIKLPEKNPAPWGEFPIVFKRILADYAIQAKPFPSTLALKWLEYDPNTNFRTPAQRCKAEFEKLFTIRYNIKFKESLTLKPNKSSITISYSPASSRLPRPIKKKLTELPDLTKISTYLEQFRQITLQCENELEAYSRFLGRKPDERNSLGALALLPKVLLKLEGNVLIDQIKKNLKEILNQQENAIIEVNHLLELLSLGTSEKLSKPEITNVIQLLENIEIGIEPDIRFGSPQLKINEKAIIFSLNDTCIESPTKEYSATLLIVTLSTILSAADGNISEDEKRQIIEHIQSSLNLVKEEKTRLTAYMNWAALTELDLKGLAKRLAALSVNQKSHLANFLITLANADGYISPDEIITLKKIYKILEIDENNLYSDIHSIQTGYQELPTIISASSKQDGYKIPKSFNKEEKVVLLNERLVEKTIKDTNEIQKILTDIFVEENENKITPNPTESKKTNVEELFGLDMDHINLIKELLKKDIWDRNEFDKLCTNIGLLPDGAIENINETFFMHVGDDFLIDDNMIEINPMIFEKISELESSNKNNNQKITYCISKEIKNFESIYKLSIMDNKI
jgi:uncharacterized tellurite resistance protein B-like protein